MGTEMLPGKNSFLDQSERLVGSAKVVKIWKNCEDNYIDSRIHQLSKSVLSLNRTLSASLNAVLRVHLYCICLLRTVYACFTVLCPYSSLRVRRAQIDYGSWQRDYESQQREHG